MIDLSNDRKAVEIQILGFIRKDQVVPFRVLQHYSHLLTVESGGGATTGGGTTGGTASSADITTGINNSVDIDTIIAELKKQDVTLKSIEESLSGSDATTVNKADGTATNVVQEILPANATRKEVVFQNKDLNNFIYLSIGAVDVSLDTSFSIPPLGTIAFDNLKAQMRITVITEDNTKTAKFYHEEVL